MNTELYQVLILWIVAGISYAFGRWLEHRKWVAYLRHINKQAQQVLQEVYAQLDTAQQQDQCDDKPS